MTTSGSHSSKTILCSCCVKSGVSQNGKNKKKTKNEHGWYLWSFCNFTVFLENVLWAHLNKMRAWCETMETNQTKTLLAESLGHNYSAASTSSILRCLLFSCSSFIPALIGTEKCSKVTVFHCRMTYNTKTSKMFKCTRFLFLLCQTEALISHWLHLYRYQWKCLTFEVCALEYQPGTFCMSSFISSTLNLPTVSLKGFICLSSL